MNIKKYIIAVLVVFALGGMNGLVFSATDNGEERKEQFVENTPLIMLFSLGHEDAKCLFNEELCILINELIEKITYEENLKKELISELVANEKFQKAAENSVVLAEGYGAVEEDFVEENAIEEEEDTAEESIVTANDKSVKDGNFIVELKNSERFKTAFESAEACVVK